MVELQAAEGNPASKQVNAEAAIAALQRLRSRGHGGRASAASLVSGACEQHGKAARQAVVRQADHLDRASVLAGDLVEIAQARAALMAAEKPVRQGHSIELLSRSRVAWVPIVLHRTADSVPIILGTALGGLLLVVFSMAALFANFAR